MAPKRYNSIRGIWRERKREERKSERKREREWPETKAIDYRKSIYNNAIKGITLNSANTKHKRKERRKKEIEKTADSIGV